MRAISALLSSSALFKTELGAAASKRKRDKRKPAKSTADLQHEYPKPQQAHIPEPGKRRRSTSAPTPTHCHSSPFDPPNTGVRGEKMDRPRRAAAKAVQYYDIREDEEADIMHQSESEAEVTSDSGEEDGDEEEYESDAGCRPEVLQISTSHHWNPLHIMILDAYCGVPMRYY